MHLRHNAVPALERGVALAAILVAFSGIPALAQKPGAGGVAGGPAGAGGSKTAATPRLPEVILERRAGAGEPDPVVSGLRVTIKAPSPQPKSGEGLQFQLELSNFSGQEVTLTNFLRPLRISILNEAGRLQGTPLAVSAKAPESDDAAPNVWLKNINAGKKPLQVADVLNHGLSLPPNGTVSLEFAVKSVDESSAGKTTRGPVKPGTYFVCPLVPLKREGQPFVIFSNGVDRGKNVLIKYGE